MSYVIESIILLLWIGIFFGSIIAIIEGYDEQNLIWIIGGVIGLILCLATALWGLNQKDNKPCVHYETNMQYNAATKTIMPMRYCAQYGEWVK